MEAKLKQLIDGSNSILITSHIGPDGDSISSSILLHKILKTNHPDKQVTLAMEEEAPSLAFVDGYDNIQFLPLAEAIKQAKPELVMMLDANNLNRLTREPQAVRPLLDGIKTAIIDHHEPDGKDEADVYINLSNPANALDIYEVFIEQLGYQKPAGYAQVAILGIYTDTGGFIYKMSNHTKTLAVVAKLIEDGANLELIANRLNAVSTADLKVLNELIKNTDSIGNCTFSFISDEFIATTTYEAVRQATDLYRNAYLRNIDGRPWGFLVYKDLLAEGTYSVSFRALSDTVDVSKLAAALGGGGHKPAAGARIKAGSLDEALAKVKTVVETADS